MTSLIAIGLVLMGVGAGWAAAFVVMRMLRSSWEYTDINYTDVMPGVAVMAVGLALIVLA